MTDYVTFEGRVEPVQWGRATYTVLRLPSEIVGALGKTRRVEGEIAEHPVNLALSRAPVIEGVFLWAGQTLLDKAGITPLDPVEVRLRPAPDDVVDTPDDVAAALRAQGKTKMWDALTAGKKRGFLYQVDSAKTEATRQKRIAKLIEGLDA
jgi:hypothetical protein